MKKITKKLATVIAAISISSSLGCATAFASQCYYEFRLTYSDKNGVDFTDPNPKDDDEQTAYVYTTSGNIISGDLLYMSVYKVQSYSEINRVTGWKRVSSNNGRYLMDYFSTSFRPAGSVNYLCGDTDRYDVDVSGYWYS